MTQYTAKRNPNRPPTHPDALLREDIDSGMRDTIRAGMKTPTKLGKDMHR